MITFKSRPLFFFKERDGIKPNTVRFDEPKDERFVKLRDCTHPPRKIKIVNAGNPSMFFIREIQDISYLDGIWIISFVAC